jgi:hypothetical protein
MKKIISRVSRVLLVIICAFAIIPQIQVSAATTITDNYTKATAYNFGRWSSITSSPTVIMAEGADESWFKFTVAADEHIYIRTSSDKKYEGMSVQIKNSNGVNVGSSQNNPDNIIDTTGVTPALYIDVDNDTTSTQTFYLVVSRGDTYESPMYFGFSAYNRIRTGSGTFTFSGSASNTGNSGMSLSGVDSNILSLNLTNNTAIPNGAIVKSVTTSGTQSPSQGGVHHMIMPASLSIWYTSIVAYPTSGSYTISLSDEFAAKQIWFFKYNALASAKSTMKKIELKINWTYDLNQTEYQLFLN